MFVPRAFSARARRTLTAGVIWFSRLDQEHDLPARFLHSFNLLSLFGSDFKELLEKRHLRMFELVEKHPSHWPPFVPPTKPEVQTTGAGTEEKAQWC